MHVSGDSPNKSAKEEKIPQYFWTTCCLRSVASQDITWQGNATTYAHTASMRTHSFTQAWAHRHRQTVHTYIDHCMHMLYRLATLYSHFIFAFQDINNDATFCCLWSMAIFHCSDQPLFLYFLCHLYNFSNLVQNCYSSYVSVLFMRIYLFLISIISQPVI